MIRAGYLDSSRRQELTALVRDGKAESRVTRRANALLLLDDGLSCEAIAKVLYMDDDTIRYWHKLYQDKGLKWLAEFGYKGRVCELTAEQQDSLSRWVAETLPGTTSVVGEWLEKTFGISYTQSAIIKILNRLGMEYRKRVRGKFCVSGRMPVMGKDGELSERLFPFLCADNSGAICIFQAQKISA